MAPDAASSPARSYAILLTAPQPAAIATIRLAGPAATPFAAAHLDKTLQPQRCVHCNLIDAAGDVIDDVVAVHVSADVIDISVHGGVWVVQSVLDLAEQFGFAKTPWHAAPPALVFETDDPIEQQTLLDLPRAATREALAMLLGQPMAWRDLLKTPKRAAIQRAIDDRTLERLLNPPTVALIGAPNVGKSTLANQLFAREHSITADVPGTTRDWVGERANLDGLIVTLIDTPGQRATEDAIEAAAIARARPVIREADLVIIVLDATRSITAAESGLLAEHASSIAVINKCDAGSPADDGLGNDAIAISARSGAGVDRLRRIIHERLGCADLTSSHARCWTAPQREELTKILTRISID